MKVYSTTPLGKKVSGDISAPHSDAREVLLALRETPSGIDEIVVGTGIQKGKVRRLLRDLCRKRLCTELTGRTDKYEG